MADEVQDQGKPQDPPGGGDQPDKGQERTFTQAELDEIIKDRLGRERGKYADYKELQAKASKLEELEAAQLSELEKAQRAAEKANAEKEAALKQAQQMLIRSAFVAEAARQGAKHPDDAYALADRSGVMVDDDGKVAGVDAAVKQLLDAGRLVMGAPKAPDLDGGAGDGERASGKPAPLTPEELSMAKKMRLTPEQYAEGKKILNRGG